MNHLIVGDCIPLIDDQLQAIAIEHTGHVFQRLGEQVSLNDVLNMCQQSDMFTPKKGMVMRQPKWLKASTKSDLLLLDKVLQVSSNQDVVLVIVAKTMDKRSAVFKRLKQFPITHTNAEPFKDWEAQKIMTWMLGYCKKNKVTIEMPAAQMLVNAYGTQVGIIKQELNKFMDTIFPKTSITLADMHAVSSHALGHYNQLSVAIRAGNIQRICLAIHELLVIKEDAYKIVSQLVFLVNQALPMALGLVNKMSPDAVAQALNKHPYFVKKQMEEFRNNPLNNSWHRILGWLCVMDERIKTGKLTAKQSLIWFSNCLKYQQ